MPKQWLHLCIGACFGNSDSAAERAVPGAKYKQGLPKSVPAASGRVAANASASCVSLVEAQERNSPDCRTLFLLDVQQQRFGGLEPTLLLVNPSDAPRGTESSAVTFFSNATADVFLGCVDPHCAATSQAILRFFREREPRLLDALVRQLNLLARTDPALRGLPIHLDAAAYASDGQASLWAFAVASPCVLRAPRFADLRRTFSRLRASSPINLQTLPSGEEHEECDLPALLVRFQAHHAGPRVTIPSPSAATGGPTSRQATPPLHECAVLSGLTAFAVTAVAVSSGDVLYQNAASRLYWGDLCVHPALQDPSEGLDAAGAAGPMACDSGKALKLASGDAAVVEPLQLLSTSPGPTRPFAGLPTGPLHAAAPITAGTAAATPHLGAAAATSAGTAASPADEVLALLRGAAAEGSVHRLLLRVPSLARDVDAGVGLGLRDPVGSVGGRGVARLSGGGQGLLQQLFALEPCKLERLLQDTCIEGRAWRGIVKVAAAAAATSGPATAAAAQAAVPPPPPLRSRLECSSSAAVDPAPISSAQIDVLLRSFTTPPADADHTSARDSLDVPSLPPRLGPGPPPPDLSSRVSSPTLAQPRGSHTQHWSPGPRALRSPPPAGADEDGGYASLTLQDSALSSTVRGRRPATASQTSFLATAGGSTGGRRAPLSDALAASAPMGGAASRKASLVLLDTDPLATSVWSMLSAEAPGGTTVAIAGGGQGGEAIPEDGSDGGAAATTAPVAPLLHTGLGGGQGQGRRSDVGLRPLEVKGVVALETRGSVSTQWSPHGGASSAQRDGEQPPSALSSEGMEHAPKPTQEPAQAPLATQPSLSPQASRRPLLSPQALRQPSKASLSAIAMLRYRGAGRTASLARLELGSRSESCSARHATQDGAAVEPTHRNPADTWRALTLACGSEAAATAQSRTGATDRDACLDRDPGLRSYSPSSGKWSQQPDAARAAAGFVSTGGSQPEGDGSYGRLGGKGGGGGWSMAVARSSKSFTMACRAPSSTSMPRVVAFASSLRHAPQLPVHTAAAAAAPPPLQPSVELQLQLALESSQGRRSGVPAVGAAAADGVGAPAAAAATAVTAPAAAAALTGSTSLTSRLFDNSLSLQTLHSSGLPASGAGRGFSCGLSQAAASPTFAERRPASWALAAPGGGCGGFSTGAGASDVLPAGSVPSAFAATPSDGAADVAGARMLCAPAAAASLPSANHAVPPPAGPALAPAAAAKRAGLGGTLGLADRSPALAGVGAEEQEQERWHEVTVMRSTDPATGQQLLLLVQTDVTAKVVAERHIAMVSETEHRLLEQIFPRHVLAYMTEEGGPWAAGGGGGGGAASAHAASWRPLVHDINKLATSHKEVTLLFADIQGFTPMCKVLEPRVVMAFLNDLFTRFDKRLDEFGVYKVETIGDCYFVAGGLVHEDADGMVAVRQGEDHMHAEKVFMFAKAMLAAASQVRLPTTGGPVRMRIGIHSGPVVSGVVGQRMPRFCLFGDTVNTTSRMESSGVPGCIHASDAAHALLRGEAWVPTGGIEVKGKGLMKTYLWAPPDSDMCPEAAALLARYSAASATTGSSAGAQPGPPQPTRFGPPAPITGGRASQDRGCWAAGPAPPAAYSASTQTPSTAATGSKRSAASTVPGESSVGGGAGAADRADSAATLAQLLLSGN